MNAAIEARINSYSPDKSHNSNTKVKVRFFNYCKDPIKIWWLDYQGEKVQYFEDRRILPRSSCDMQQTFLTHPWVFTNESSGEPVFVQYSSDKRKYFEVLRFAYDQLKNGKIDSDEFRKLVRGEEYVHVGVVGEGSLAKISATVIVRLIKKKYAFEENYKFEEAVDTLNLPATLREEFMNINNEIYMING